MVVSRVAVFGARGSAEQSRAVQHAAHGTKVTHSVYTFLQGLGLSKSCFV